MEKLTHTWRMVLQLPWYPIWPLRKSTTKYKPYNADCRRFRQPPIPRPFVTQPVPPTPPKRLGAFQPFPHQKQLIILIQKPTTIRQTSSLQQSTLANTTKTPHHLMEVARCSTRSPHTLGLSTTLSQTWLWWYPSLRPSEPCEPWIVRWILLS